MSKQLPRYSANVTVRVKMQKPAIAMWRASSPRHKSLYVGIQKKVCKLPICQGSRKTVHSSSKSSVVPVKRRFFHTENARLVAISSVLRYARSSPCTAPVISRFFSFNHFLGVDQSDATHTSSPPAARLQLCAPRWKCDVAIALLLFY